MNTILERSLHIAVEASNRSKWFRETLAEIRDQEDHEKTALGAFELLRVVKQHQREAIHEYNCEGDSHYVKNRR